MPRAPFIAYGIISVLTPILVLINSFLVVSNSSPTPQSFQSIALMRWMMKPNAANIITAYDLMPERLKEHPQAHVITEKEQLFQEIHHSLEIPLPWTDVVAVLESLFKTG